MQIGSALRTNKVVAALSLAAIFVLGLALAIFGGILFIASRDKPPLPDIPRGTLSQKGTRLNLTAQERCSSQNEEIWPSTGNISYENFTLSSAAQNCIEELELDMTQRYIHVTLFFIASGIIALVYTFVNVCILRTRIFYFQDHKTILAAIKQDSRHSEPLQVKKLHLKNLQLRHQNDVRTSKIVTAMETTTGSKKTFVGPSESSPAGPVTSQAIVLSPTRPIDSQATRTTTTITTTTGFPDSDTNTIRTERIQTDEASPVTSSHLSSKKSSRKTRHSQHPRSINWGSRRPTRNRRRTRVKNRGRRPVTRNRRKTVRPIRRRQPMQGPRKRTRARNARLTRRRRKTRVPTNRRALVKRKRQTRRAQARRATERRAKGRRAQARRAKGRRARTRRGRRRGLRSRRRPTRKFSRRRRKQSIRSSRKQSSKPSIKRPKVEKSKVPQTTPKESPTAKTTVVVESEPMGVQATAAKSTQTDFGQKAPSRPTSVIQTTDAFSDSTLGEVSVLNKVIINDDDADRDVDAAPLTPNVLRQPYTTQQKVQTLQSSTRDRILREILPSTSEARLTSQHRFKKSKSRENSSASTTTTFAKNIKASIENTSHPQIPVVVIINKTMAHSSKDSTRRQATRKAKRNKFKSSHHARSRVILLSSDHESVQSLLTELLNVMHNPSKSNVKRSRRSPRISSMHTVTQTSSSLSTSSSELSHNQSTYIDLILEPT